MMVYLERTKIVELTFTYNKCTLHKLRCILDFELSRNQRQGSEFFLGKWIFMMWFPVAFITNGVLKVTHGEIELTAPVL